MSTTILQRLDDTVVDVRPGDQHASTVVEGWLQAYATSCDPVLRERIILAYLGLADRLLQASPVARASSHSRRLAAAGDARPLRR